METKAQQGAPAIRTQYDDTIVIANENEAKQEAIDISTAKVIAEALHAHYPGHMWAVNVRGEQGIATIHNLMLSGTHGYRMHLDKRYSVSDLVTTAKIGAGEILERFNVARGRINHDKMNELPTDFAGRVIGDLSK